MNETQCIRAVHDGTEVAAMTAQRQVHAIGKVIGYCDSPQVLILTEAGARIWWRADMTTEVE